jgi:hypothetical protein
MKGSPLRVIRYSPRTKSEPITARTYDVLLAELERAYPGKWRRAVDVTPVAVCKTVDNEADALETIRRIRTTPGAPRGSGMTPAARELRRRARVAEDEG